VYIVVRNNKCFVVLSQSTHVALFNRCRRLVAQTRKEQGERPPMETGLTGKGKKAAIIRPLLDTVNGLGLRAKPNLEH
jgi:hypothetical protein